MALTKASCTKIFENIVFGEIGTKDKNKKGIEPNTEDEQEILENIVEFVGQNAVNPRIKKAYTKCMDCKTHYPVLQPPPTTSLYRGLKVYFENQKKLGINLSNITKRKTIEGIDLIGYDQLYTPKHSVESWTTEPGVAFGFATRAGLAYPSEGVEAMKEIKKAVADMNKRMGKLAKQLDKFRLEMVAMEGGKKLKTIDRAEDFATKTWDDLYYELGEMSQEGQRLFTEVVVVIEISPDSDCIFNPDLSNKISANYLGGVKEYEVARIGGAKGATWWFPAAYLEYAQMVEGMRSTIAQIKENFKKKKSQEPFKYLLRDVTRMVSKHKGLSTAEEIKKTLDKMANLEGKNA